VSSCIGTVPTRHLHWERPGLREKKRAQKSSIISPKQFPTSKRWRRHSSVRNVFGFGTYPPTADGLVPFAFSRRFWFPLQSHLATKARTGRSPETGLAQGYRAREDLAPYANRDPVSERTHTLQGSLVAFQVRSRSSSLSPLGLLTQQTCSGHLQTGYAVVGDFAQADPVVYDRFVTCAILSLL